MNKPFYASRGVWLGIITTLIGSLQIVVELLAGNISAEGVALAAIGILKIWERFTRTV